MAVDGGLGRRRRGLMNRRGRADQAWPRSRSPASPSSQATICSAASVGATSRWCRCVISACSGGLVGAVDAGEVLQLAGAGLLVEALHVARLGHRQRRVDEDLDELAVAPAARAPCRRSARNGEMKRDQHDQAGVDHQLGDLGDAADVLDPVVVGEAQVLVEAVADVVAVEQVGVAAVGVQPLLHQVGDGRLARAREAGEPDHAAVLALQRPSAAALSTSSACQWMFWLRRSAKCSMPAPTVRLDSRSIRMKPPRSWFSA